MVEFVYVVGYCQYYTFGFYVLFAPAKETSESHILLQFTERAFCLNTPVYSEITAFFRKNPFQIP
jgi:hypothetical protein